MEINLIEQKFELFLQNNGIDREFFRECCLCDFPRYFRILKVSDLSKEKVAGILQQIHTDLGVVPQETAYLENFFWIPQFCSLKNLSSYRSNEIHGMDAASGIAVKALRLCRDKDIRVLDLCCAVGNKLSLISEMIGSSGLVVGIDIAEERMLTCRSICRRNRVTNAMLIVDNGSTFDPSVPFKVYNRFKKRNKRLRKKRQSENFLLQEIFEMHNSRNSEKLERYCSLKDIFVATSSDTKSNSDLTTFPTLQFDRILVDAECTHDASIRHIRNFSADWKMKAFNESILDDDNLNTICESQEQLILRGFYLLRPGGFLVYSTCSFCVRQNEAIVANLLEVTGKQNYHACIAMLPHDVLQSLGTSQSRDQLITSLNSESLELILKSARICDKWCDSSGIIHSSVTTDIIKNCIIRLNPLTTRTDGLFVAVFVKLASTPDESC